MSRTKRGVITKAKHKKVLKLVKGQYGRRKNTIRIARQAMEKAMQYAYRDRRAKKRDFRSLWIQRINAGVRPEGLTYSKFINALNSRKLNWTGKYWQNWLIIIQKSSNLLLKRLNPPLTNKNLSFILYKAKESNYFND